MISITNLTKKYGENKIFEKSSVKIPSGRTLLVGPNGSGKTTLLSMIYGVRMPNSGTIEYDGINVAKYPEKIRKWIAYVPSEGHFPQNLKVNEILEYIACFTSNNNIEHYMSFFEVNFLRKRKFKEMSAGEQQLIELVVGFALNKKLLLLDEPVTYVDRLRRYKVVQLINRTNKDLIWTTHEEDMLFPTYDHLIKIKRSKEMTTSEIIVHDKLRLQYKFMVSDYNKVREILNNNNIDYKFENGEFIVFDDIKDVFMQLFDFVITLQKVIAYE